MGFQKKKYDSDGSIKYKARLVANRSSQIQNIDCFDTFALVTEISSS